jgi:hypothetical protein
MSLESGGDGASSEVQEVGVVRIVLVLAFMVMSVGAASQQPPVNPFAQEMVDFRKRVDEYMKLRGEITRKVPEVKETADPAKISAREQALGQAISAARASATQGDIFGDEMSRYLRTILAEDWKSRSAADRKALFEEIPPTLKLTVNQAYPTTIPLVTVPARLLAKLPMLPEVLEYRLVDHYFLLRDRDANLIIDVLPKVYPTRNR